MGNIGIDPYLKYFCCAFVENFFFVLVKYAESSSDSSDNEPLVKIKKTTTKEQKISAGKKKKSVKGRQQVISNEFNSVCWRTSLFVFVKELSAGNSSDDGVLLVNLIAKKKKQLKKNTKTKTVSQGTASKNRQGILKAHIILNECIKLHSLLIPAVTDVSGVSDESSDDEPLINLVKKNQTRNKTNTKASVPKKRDTTPKKPQKKPVSGKEWTMEDKLICNVIFGCVGQQIFPFPNIFYKYI